MPQQSLARYPQQPPANVPDPPDYHYIFFSNWRGMNTKDSRLGLEKDDLSWVENFIPSGKNNWVSAPGSANPLTTVAGVSFWVRQQDCFFNGQHFFICFGNNGSGWQINKATGAQVQFAANGTFSSAPDLTVYRASRVLIADSSAGYCTWDGTAFAKQGTVSPNLTVTNGGMNFTSGGTFTITGGSGSGASGTFAITGSVVTSLLLTNPGSGYKLGDSLTVVFSGGGGSGAAANAFVWPFLGGLQPISVDVWQGQVWLIGAASGQALSNARILQWSGITSQDATNPTAISYDNFANGGTGSTSILDQDVTEGLTAVRNLNNFLYIFGSNSSRQIGTKTISPGPPIVTNFSITTISSDNGTPWKYSVVSYNKFVAFANPTGIYMIFGTSVEKISEMQDGLFGLYTGSGPSPQAAVVDIFAKHILVLLLQINDPVAGIRQVLIALASKTWFVLSAGNIRSITSSASGSLFQLWGGFAGDATQLFSNITAPSQIRVSTSLDIDGNPKQAKRFNRAWLSHSSGTSAVNLMFAAETENGSQPSAYSITNVVTFASLFGIVSFSNNLGQVVSFGSGGYLFKPLNILGTGMYLGVTLTGSVTSFTLNAITLEYAPTSLMRNL